jgi:hypothetical protein
LLVIIDVQPKEVGVPTDAYFAVEEIKDVSTSLFTTDLTFDTGWGSSLKVANSGVRMAQQPPRPLSTPPR